MKYWIMPLKQVSVTHDPLPTVLADEAIIPGTKNETGSDRLLVRFTVMVVSPGGGLSGSPARRRINRTFAVRICVSGEQVLSFGAHHVC